MQMSKEKFIYRHIGSGENEVRKMLETIGVSSLEELVDKTVPDDIRIKTVLDIPEGMTEYDYLKRIKFIASKNKVFRSFIGTGFYNTVFPAVIQRNILENPSWYTSYTPYQAEISQGRLEALLNFQTAITELTAMDLANASLLDESTAAAEAILMLYNVRSREKIKNNCNRLFVDENIFPQTLDVIKTRTIPLGIELEIQSFSEATFDSSYFAAFIQYPTGDGKILDYTDFAKEVQAHDIKIAVAADILSLTLLVPPGEWGADVVVGSTQRFGIPMGYGGPHAAYFAAKEEYKRHIPGRIIGISKDRHGNMAYRMALQTREQHIKRERATSNICTAQALLAIMAGMYTLYHGPEGLKRIAKTIHSMTNLLHDKIIKLGFQQENTSYFDTLKIQLPDNISQKDIKIFAMEREINLRYYNESHIGISLDETTTIKDINNIAEIFASIKARSFSRIEKISRINRIPDTLKRKSDFMQQQVFNMYHSETEMMRYIKKLERKDISLTHSMIPLGSCTMKLNAATELLPLSWPEFGEIHPFVPFDQTEGYQQLFHELRKMLIEITGLSEVSYQPNSGAAGEYAGLLVIRKYHISRGEQQRKIVLIPSSAHGTNPASAAMAGMQIRIVQCDDKGNIDVKHLEELCISHASELAAFMVTYPSTHGVFESSIKELTKIVHTYGGQVYLDGANLNAQVGLTNPAKIGADVCHMNLHKTFGIPHGGGGPGAGPIAVAEHLVEFLPSHPLIPAGGVEGIHAVAAAPFGSASILTISHAYCHLLGGDGLKMVSIFAILNANYLAVRLKKHFDIVYTAKNGFVAHEMIIDCRQFKSFNITEVDIAKRIMDYGFHAPTLSFPVHGTLMIEPTESESLQELERFIEALYSIYHEIEILKDNYTDNNILKNSPHTAKDISSDNWSYPYTRKQAAFALPWIEENKYWPPVGRIDDAFGDRNLICSCISTTYFNTIKEKN